MCMVLEHILNPCKNEGRQQHETQTPETRGTKPGLNPKTLTFQTLNNPDPLNPKAEGLTCTLFPALGLVGMLRHQTHYSSHK